MIDNPTLLEGLLEGESGVHSVDEHFTGSFPCVLYIFVGSQGDKNFVFLTFTGAAGNAACMW